MARSRGIPALITLEARALRAGYGMREVLDGIDLALRSGERVGVIGPNGSGKTTLLRALSGTLRPMSGAVLLDGTVISDLPPRVRARRVAVVPQVFATPFAFTSREVVMLGRSSYVGAFGRPTTLDRAAVDRALALTGCEPIADRPVWQLSGGERQRVVVAMALSQEAEALLLDEPTVHLDPRHQREVLELVGALARDTGVLVLSVFHDLNLAATTCDRIVVLREGRVVRDGRPREVIESALVESVFGVGLEVGTRDGVPYVLPRSH